MSNYDKLSEGMQGDAITLPFTAPYFWWSRGDRGTDADLGSGVRHFGGWATDQNALNDSGLAIPDWLVAESFTGSNGNPFDVYAARYLNLAFIGKRERWAPDKDAQGNPRGNPRSHVQYLALCASFVKEPEKKFMYWSPVVVTAKGLSAKSLTDAANDWNRKTAALRSTMENLPAWVFYASIGTFKPQIEIKTVGQGTAKSYITPASLLIPEGEKLKQEWLRNRFVGDPVGELMLQLQDEAQTWLHAWDEQPQSQEGAVEPPYDPSYAPPARQQAPQAPRRPQAPQAPQRPAAPPANRPPTDWPPDEIPF